MRLLFTRAANAVKKMRHGVAEFYKHQNAYLDSIGLLGEHAEDEEALPMSVKLVRGLCLC